MPNSSLSLTLYIEDSPSIIYEDLPYGNSKEYEEAREKEAIAVNYLRDLSEEDTKDLISHNPTKRLDNDLNAIETSEKLARMLILTFLISLNNRY